MEKKTKLFKWNDWTVLDTFLSINFTLFTIRGFAGLIRKITDQKLPAITDAKLSKSKLSSYSGNVISTKYRVVPLVPKINYEYEPLNQSAMDSLHP
jgi:hypothetical protein